jgi:hypothetical protein
VQHRNMTGESSLQFGLEDLLVDLRHARKPGVLGRLAYCQVRRWARNAGNALLASPPR